MIPQNFNEWYKCITEKCKIDLTKEFVLKRIEILENENSAEHKKIIECYGDEHLENILFWYKQII